MKEDIMRTVTRVIEEVVFEINIFQNCVHFRNDFQN